LVSVANALPTAYERKWGTDRRKAGGGARPGPRPKGLRPWGRLAIKDGDGAPGASETSPA
jgi:hypothetical protein